MIDEMHKHKDRALVDAMRRGERDEHYITVAVTAPLRGYSCGWEFSAANPQGKRFCEVHTAAPGKGAKE